MKKLIFTITAFLFTCISLSAQKVGNENSAQSCLSDSIGFSIVSSAGCDSNYIFLATTTSIAPYIMIINNKGVPIFKRKTAGGVYDFKPQPNGTLSYYDLKTDRYYILDKNYNVIDSIETRNGVNTDLHELRILPNGNYLILGMESHTTDMSKIIQGGRTSASVIAYVIQEMDKNKNVIFQWSTWDHIDITDSYTDLTQGTIDVAHGNSIDVDFDGNLIVSLRNTQEIDKIDRKTGDIIWRLGGKKNQFKFVNDTLGFSWQHSARRLQNGNLILFDNGCRREPAVMSFSRSLEYKIDEKNKTATLVWQFRNTPDVYSIGLGYSQRLTNGNTFICWGAAVPAITEVTRTGKKVFELKFNDNYSTYRAYRYPWNYRQITSGNNIFSTANILRFNADSQDDTASAKIVLKNNNPFPVVAVSINNKERAFYVPFEFPALINANDSLVFRVYFRPDLSGSFEDTLQVSTNLNTLNIPLIGEIKTSVSFNDVRKDYDFRLEQNYPNPFNPTTVIGYQLPVAGIVTLKVYDVLGRELAILINEIQQAGRYNIQLSTSNFQLSSGVYFYRLTAGKYSETRKMLFLK